MSKRLLIEKFWYSNSIIRWLFWPLSLPFYLLVYLRRVFYEKQLIKVSHFSIPLIVVGNISVGGTGKTPFITFLAKQLRLRNMRVGIVSRGYRSNAQSYPHSINDKDTAETVGDEAFMQYTALKLPMVIGANRSLAVSQLISESEVDVVISDDGLQHYAMDRQYEILMVDAKRLFGNTLILPFGPLREPINRAKKVDYIIQNGGASLLSLKRLNSKHTVIQLQPLDLVHLLSGERVALDYLMNKEVHAVCGIGNPSRFFASLKPHCLAVDECIFPDHYQFTADDFKAFDEKMVVMTEKDAVKCLPFARQNWYYLKVAVEMRPEDTEQLMSDIQGKLFDE